MADPDRDWKPSGRPQSYVPKPPTSRTPDLTVRHSTAARNFSAALDDLFKIDEGLDTLDKKVHQKYCLPRSSLETNIGADLARKQAVSTHTQELEALEARLRETEERLKQAKSSPPSFNRKNSQHRTPIRGTFAEADKAGASDPTSFLAQVTAAPRRHAVQTGSQNSNNQTSLAPMPATLPETPRSHTSRDYVMVDRPQDGQNNGDGEKTRL